MRRCGGDAPSGAFLECDAQRIAGSASVAIGPARALQFVECRGLAWIRQPCTQSVDIGRWWGKRYTKEEFHERLSVVSNVERHVLSPAGHMLHHDQPEALAARLERFLSP